MMNPRNLIHSIFSLNIRRFSLKFNPNDKMPHNPVMADEVIEFLQTKESKIYIDMTFGAGGHSKRILKFCPNVTLFGLDRDPIAYKYGEELAKSAKNFTPLRGKFSDLPSLLSQYNIRKGSVDAMLFDFGCSSMQFDQAERGFSINNEGPLDMRMDNSPENVDLTAAEILANIKEEDLAKILRTYGEEKQAKKIARAIIETRYKGIELKTTHDLSDLVAAACGTDHRQDKLQRHAHSATKVFQALRIFVNNEINEINYGMILAHHYLKIGGKLVTLTFHSLEDKIVKRHILGNVVDNAANPIPLKYLDSGHSHDQQDLNELTQSDWKQLNKHVLTPSDEEVATNPRSRSAKLRVAMKIN